MKIEIDGSQELKDKRIFSFTIIGETKEEDDIIKYVKESSETIERHESESSRVGSSDSKCQASDHLVKDEDIVRHSEKSESESNDLT